MEHYYADHIDSNYHCANQERIVFVNNYDNARRLAAEMSSLDSSTILTYAILISH